MKPLLKTLSICTLAALFNAPAFSMEEGEITIWINGDKSYAGLAEIGRLCCVIQTRNQTT